MAVPAPLSDTERLVDWDELPDRVRAMRDDFDPAAAGVWMAHQTAWIRFRQHLNIAVAAKGRRTGITLSEAQDSSLIAATAKEAGGDNVWYIGDTREKGLEFIGYCAKISQVVARGQATRIEQHIYHDQKPDGSSREIQAFRIRYSSGFRITSLSSRPENIHGLQGVVVIDEAALHRDVRAVLESATALLIWGGKIRVISTHRGKRNPFNELIADIEAGRYGDKAGVFRVTFDDAVANGLYERVCWMTRQAPSPEGKRDWYQSIRKAYGPRQAAMREELDAIPRDGSGAAIPGIWIERAMPEVRPVVRLVCDDDFARRDEADRHRWADRWIATHLLPVVREAAQGFTGKWAIGMDFARHRHFSVILPARITQDLRRDCPFAVEMHNTPTRQQEQILWAILGELKRWCCAIDATGPGQTIAEYTGDKFGRAELDKDRGVWRGGPVHEVTLSRAWYGQWMTAYCRLFEDGVLTLPRDAGIEDDHRAVEVVDGIPMVPKIERKDLKADDADMMRHGDSAIAGVLMAYAATNHTGDGWAYDWTPAPDREAKPSSGWRDRPDTDLDDDLYSDPHRGAW